MTNRTVADLGERRALRKVSADAVLDHTKKAEPHTQQDG